LNGEIQLNNIPESNKTCKNETYCKHKLFFEIGNPERFAAFEFCMETDHQCCFTILPQASALSPKDISKKTLQTWETFS
jgi:hypothetical protein